MIGILHGYLLDGSGSNLWTRSIARALARRGDALHLFCQEPHPEAFDFVSEAIVHDGDEERVLFRRETAYPGRCVLHKPVIGRTLPVYVWDEYEEFEEVVPMVDLPDAAIEAYLERNVRVVARVAAREGLRGLHANHAVLMSVVAQRVEAATGIPFAIMPHGSAIEYAVKRDPRFLRMARSAFEAASRVYVIGEEMRSRVEAVLPEVRGLGDKMRPLNLGVDTSEFELVDPSRRLESVRRIAPLLVDEEPGRPAGRTAEAGPGAESAPDARALADALAAADPYPAKAPDADAAAKLEALPWGRAPVLLFVGRLIAAKGIHAVVAALPLILERRPDARLVVVGHGPLREPLEALVRALRTGDRRLVELIARTGGWLEDAMEGRAEGEPEDAPLVELAALLRSLDERGSADAYFAAAREHLREDTVTFTGYLKHAELRHLFPCCDVAIFPSIVREAGPLVFLEAMASGCFPMGTYFAGMAASIDAAAGVLPPDAVEAMKLTPEPAHVAADVARQVPAALAVAAGHREALRRLAVERYDWESVARRLADDLGALPTAAGAPGRGAD